MKRLLVSLILLSAGLVIPVQAPAAVTTTTPVDYCGTQCLDILPPGQNGNATFTDLLLFRTLGIRPPHFSDTLAPYQNLVWNYSGITDDRLGAYFDSAAFGVRPGDVASTTRPRADVTIVRDRSRGIPHITGTTREGTLFGAGYAGAQDRLFVMDVFRHLGRGQLTPFAGGGPANRALEQDLWRTAPYTEAELQNQIDILDDMHGAQGAQLQRDLQAWVAGVNRYIDTVGIAYPGEYVALGLPRPQRWRPTDVVATAAVIAGIFGGGGGGEIQSALALIEARVRYGAAGTGIWKSFRSQNDPETNHTVHNGTSFPYGQTEEEPAGRALPDRGSVTTEPLVVDSTTPAGAATTPLLKQPMSNALLVSGAHTKSGHPIAVYGPQTGYFAPQLWMRQELQGPGISSRGAAFAGLNFYNLLGRGVDYSWSATSAGQDITDTYAVRLCEPGGGTPTVQSLHYVFRGTCTPMETLERRNAWKQSLGSPEPAGAYTLRVRRTKLGIVSHRGTVGGVPVAFTRNRSTYMNEAGSALGFMLFNDPNAVRSAKDFQQAAHKVGYAFNWFYADSNDIGYFNSGDNPVRPSGADPNLPTWGEQQYEWVGWDPASNRAAYTHFDEHPQVINQDYLTSWNNKQAPGYSAADGNFGYGAVHRVQPLDDRIQAVIQSGDKFTRGKLVEAMEDAATVDLRADKVLPLLIRVLESAPIAEPSLADAVAKLKAWQRAGGHRLAPRGSSTYAHSEAIRILDAWWPRLVQAQFRPALGPDLYGALARTLPLDQRANPQGSAYQAGWWSFVHRDLRKVLGEPAPQPVTYCGGGDLAACRAALLDALASALTVPAENPFLADRIVHQPMGGITQSPIHWVNRPTYQQVLEFPGHR